MQKSTLFNYCEIMTKFSHREEENAMSKLDFVIKVAEEKIESRCEAQHTDTTHTDYADGCLIIG